MSLATKVASMPVSRYLHLFEDRALCRRRPHSKVPPHLTLPTKIEMAVDQIRQAVAFTALNSVWLLEGRTPGLRLKCCDTVHHASRLRCGEVSRNEGGATRGGPADTSVAAGKSAPCSARFLPALVASRLKPMRRCCITCNGKAMVPCRGLA